MRGKKLLIQEVINAINECSIEANDGGSIFLAGVTPRLSKNIKAGNTSGRRRRLLKNQRRDSNFLQRFNRQTLLTDEN